MIYLGHFHKVLRKRARIMHCFFNVGCLVQVFSQYVSVRLNINSIFHTGLWLLKDFKFVVGSLHFMLRFSHFCMQRIERIKPWKVERLTESWNLETKCKLSCLKHTYLAITELRTSEVYKEESFCRFCLEKSNLF